jgi:hypothetical protein
MLHGKIMDPHFCKSYNLVPVTLCWGTLCRGTLCHPGPDRHKVAEVFFCRGPPYIYIYIWRLLFCRGVRHRRFKPPRNRAHTNNVYSTVQYVQYRQYRTVCTVCTVPYTMYCSVLYRTACTVPYSMYSMYSMYSTVQYVQYVQYVLYRTVCTVCTICTVP